MDRSSSRNKPMKFVPVSLFLPQDHTVNPPPPHLFNSTDWKIITIDNSPDDNGALACMRAACQAQQQHVYGDGSTGEAFENLRQDLHSNNHPNQLGVILGHGCMGVISTGSGRSGMRDDQNLGFYNEQSWGDVN